MCDGPGRPASVTEALAMLDHALDHLAAAIAGSLATGDLSESWARQLCEWTGQLPEARRSDADEILVGAARAGADLAGLAGLAREMYERSHKDAGGEDSGSRFSDRAVWLGVTFGGAGRLTGDLTPGCSAALSAVLDALAKRAGPEDIRTAAQRRHDALEEAARRLIAAGMLPGRAGQPAQIQVHMTLSQLRGTPGAATVESAWMGARAAQFGWLTGPEADAAACDATIVPVVTGHVDGDVLDRLTGVYLATRDPDFTQDPDSAQGPDSAQDPDSGRGRAPQPLSPATRQRLSRALLGLAADALSGPAGLAARLPLDIGAATESIPAHLRRAVTIRHRACAFPGCDQPASVCEVHHIVPRSCGGPTALPNLVLLCRFHHLTVIHRWGWRLVLHADGGTTAISPEGRTVRSHGPPGHGPPSQAA